MRIRSLLVLAAAWLASGPHAFARKHPENIAPTDSNSAQECLTIPEAQKHVGRTRCVSGTVVRVEEGTNGVTFLDFCADYRSCPFTVIVFPGDLRNVGDVRQLQGRAVTIKGTIEEYDERAEIILRHPVQLGDGAALLPALPKDYDVERRGNFSAGTFRAKKAKHTRVKRQSPPIAITDPTDEP
jgi:DNA/RNA endonuclease YhcR with UshA esterase domain